MDSPIYIVGAPRSGTTLISKVLGKHSRLFMPGETHFFEDIYSRRKEIGQDINLENSKIILSRLSTLYERYNEPADQRRVNYLFNDHKLVEQLIAGWKNYFDVLTSFMQLQMRYEEKQRWGNNVPRDIFNYEDILEFFPKAKIIVCVRDVRDFLLSYKNKWKITISENAESLRQLYHPVITSLLWKSNINLIAVLKQKIPSKNLFINYYEKLAISPERQIKKICNFIGEEYEPNMLDVDAPNSSHKVKYKGIFSTSVGRWKEQLAHEEVYVAQRLLKKELELHGYQTERLKINFCKVVKIIITFPYFLSRGIYSRKGIRGPFLPYIARRLGTVFFKIA